jgi:glycosyltransferase involved in cell wall biosynthesis
MRILITCDPIIPVPPVGYGGIERIVDSLIGELRARGHLVGLVALDGSTCTVDALFNWLGSNVNGRIDTAFNIVSLARAVRRFRPDVVHSFSRLAYLFGLLPSKLPKIMSYQRHVRAGQTKPALRLARDGSLHFTGCSEFICRQGRPSGGDWEPIYNFADVSRINYVASVPADAPLLFLSRVDSIKGPDLAIEIAKRSGRRLLVAGNAPTSGHEKDFFDQKVAPHLGRDGIEWIGEVGDVKKNELLGRCAAMLVPIQWHEPFGIVFAEALAAGTPVISCARGALPEIVRPGITGFFIDDVASGVAAVSKIASLDRAACRADAESRFSLGPCTDSYEKLYRRVCHQSH